MSPSKLIQLAFQKKNASLTNATGSDGGFPRKIKKTKQTKIE